MKQARILIAADLVPSETNFEKFEKGTMEDLLGEELAELWKGADYRIVNLEVPFIDGGKPIKKSGPNMSAPTRCFTGLRTLKVSCAAIANNHIMDFGADGLKNTIGLLDAAGIQHTGTGMDRREADKGIDVDINGIRLGIYACSEHEFSAAGIHTPGANAIGVNTCLRIAELKKSTDYVIVLFHGGKQHYPYPTPEQQFRCRSFADAGADLVVCQHSHCVGCEETYNDSTIVYGEGNFISDYQNDECWETGLLIELRLEQENKIDSSIIYHPIHKNEHATSCASGETGHQIMDGFYARGKALDRVEAMFIEETQKESLAFLRCLAGWSRWLRGIDRILLKDALIKRKYSAKSRLLPLGVMLCETNWEVTESALRRENGS
ncbi:MAG: CapA family protein [Clostridium lundense]|jgi:poly-gamma-glutamate synthesis protein (capsule biosynthesis protein)|nr:CapA family protein [Clostridium lundense]